MKRDMDLVRALLLKVEAERINEEAPAAVLCRSQWFDVEGFDRETVLYNFDLLVNARFIKLHHRQLAGHRTFLGLTWAGHDFLDKVRDPEIWRETKEEARAAGGFSLDLLGALAKGLIKKKIEQHTGIELDL